MVIRENGTSSGNTIVCRDIVGNDRTQGIYQQTITIVTIENIGTT